VQAPRADEPDAGNHRDEGTRPHHDWKRGPRIHPEEAERHRSGDWLELRRENLTLPAGQPCSIYALAALIPILPAKQRFTQPQDWMTTDTEIACPGPNCGARFRISRIGTRTFRHRDVTAVPLPPG
jgi:uncharacterized repeat protein (TIGR04076 family)